MEAKINVLHPLILNQDVIARENVVVMDNVSGTPVYGEAYIAPEMLIVICHQGQLWATDFNDAIFGAHDVGLLLPEHIVVAKEASDDYLATVIAVSRQLSDQILVTYPYTRHAPLYRRDPATHLTDAQYNTLVDATNLLRSLTKSQSVNRTEMLSNLLAIIINLIGEYYVSNRSTKMPHSSREQLFNQFYNALVEHYRESHEVSFYARLCCLSPKHFSQVIKDETGISAFDWISTFITMHAKTLLDSSHNYSIQQVSELLGFCEQSAFSRFFKRMTGMTPSKYKDR